MAKNPPAIVSIRIQGKKHRKGIHSKCRNSNAKASKLYVKPYRGQGK